MIFAWLEGWLAGTRPLWEQLHAWLGVERGRVPDGSATAKAIECSLNRWVELTHNLLDGEVRIDSNSIENLVRPWAMRRQPWLFAGNDLRASAL